MIFFNYTKYKKNRLQPGILCAACETIFCFVKDSIVVNKCGTFIEFL